MAQEDDDDDGLEALFDYGRQQPTACTAQESDEEGEQRKRPLESTQAGTVTIRGGGDDDDNWLPPPPKLSKKATAASLYHLRARQAELLLLSQKACNNIEELDRQAQTRTPAQVEDRVVLRVRDKAGGVQSFSVRMDDPLEKLFSAYASAANTLASSLVFRFDGEEVAASATPRSLNVEREDLLEVFGEDTPGSLDTSNLQLRKIVIKVQDKSGGIYSYRVGMEDKFERLFAAYASTTKTSKSNLVFRFDGELLHGSATPRSLDMEDEDTIEVFTRPQAFCTDAEATN